MLEIAYEAILEAGGNRSKAARALEISPRTMRSYAHQMKRIGLDVPPTSTQIGLRQLMAELEEFRAGKRKADPRIEDYCHACGRIKTKVP